MRRAKVLALGMLSISLAFMPAPASAQSKLTIDQGAVAAAQRMKAYLHGLKSFEVRADATMEESLDNDLKVQLTNRVRYEYRAPDKLFAEWQSDRQLRRLYYDGRKLTLVSPLAGYYTTVDQTGSVADVLQRISQKYGLVFPLPDLFLWAWSTEPAQGITAAMNVGPAMIVKAPTDQYLFRQGDVDWQIWIARGQQALPRKLVVTDRSDPTRPSYAALLQWNPDVAIPDDHFTFAPPASSQRIEFATFDAKGAK